MKEGLINEASVRQKMGNKRQYTTARIGLWGKWSHGEMERRMRVQRRGNERKGEMIVYNNFFCLVERSGKPELKN